MTPAFRTIMGLRAAALLSAIAAVAPALGQSAVAHLDYAPVMARAPYLANSWQIGGAETLGQPVSNSTAGSNSIHCYPGYFYGYQSMLSTLGARINTTSAGGNLQVAIYGDNPATHRPTGFPLVSSASLSTATAGPVSTTQTTSGATINVLLTTQRLWWCSNFDNITATANGFTSTPAMSALMGGTATQSNLQNTSNLMSGVTVPQTFGTWPDLTSATFTEQNSLTWVGVQFMLSATLP